MRICECAHLHFVFRMHLRQSCCCVVFSPPPPYSTASAAGELRSRYDLRSAPFGRAPRMPHPSRGRMSERRTCGIKYRLITSASGMCAATFPFFIDRRRWKARRQRMHLANSGKSLTCPHIDALLGTHALFLPAEGALDTRAWVNFPWRGCH